MRHCVVLLCLLLAVTGMQAVGCSSWYPPQGTPLGFTIPAHTERHYAAVSLPAFTADGSLYVMNGANLLHYAADGQRLSSTALSVDIDTSSDRAGAWPRALATRSGVLLITSGYRHIGLLDHALQFSWEYDADGSLSPLACGDGLLIMHYADSQYGVAYMNLNGDIRWTVPDCRLIPTEVQVDEQDRAYFCLEDILAVKQPDGADVLRFKVPGAPDGMTLLSARADRVLLAASGIASCYDMAGRRVWRAAPPDGWGWFTDGLILNQERYILHVTSRENRDQRLIVVDGAGRLITQIQDRPQWRLLLADGAGFLVGYSETVDGNPYTETWGWFNAEGVRQWSYHPPESIQGGAIPKDSPLGVYPNGTGPDLGADGRIYFERNSILYALDTQGHLLWQDQGAAYYDVWVEEMYIS